VPVDSLDDSSPAPDSPERSAEIDAGMAALASAVRELRAELRVCWVLRELEGLGYAEIAQITGASEDAVRGRIHRARVQLAEVMRPWR
jgi:RNA polymerase sigma-70 factor (ECF subfamily)